MEKTVMVLRIKGLTEDQIKEHFSVFFAGLVKEYPDQFRVGLSILKKGTEAEQKVLGLAELNNT